MSVSVASGPHRRPRLFIGSSSEGKQVALCLQLGLHPEVEATLWSQGVFGLSEGTLESLVNKAPEFDFAALVLTPDDLVEKRKATGRGPRDNVLFELGLFVGQLGRERTFLVYPQDRDLELPSDLAGVTAATYCERGDGNLRAAVGPACTVIGQKISMLVPGTQVPDDEQQGGRGRGRKWIARRRRRRSLGTARTRSTARDFGLANISVSGALLETDGPVDVGERLDLDLDLDGRSSVRVVAEVVRVQRPDWGRVGGIGVRFVEYTADAFRKIDNYVCADSAATWGFWSA